MAGRYKVWGLGLGSGSGSGGGHKRESIQVQGGRIRVGAQKRVHTRPGDESGGGHREGTLTKYCIEPSPKHLSPHIRSHPNPPSPSTA